MSAHRPPVVPEIAKAYQNDPRTALALAAMKAGTSGAPVAAGGAGYADGIARVLQGMAGTYMNNKTEDRYGKEEADLLALRKARGVDGMTGAAMPGAGVPAPMPGAGAVDANGQPVDGPSAAPAIAAALGAPPAPTPPPAPAMAAPPGIPTGAIPAPNAGGGPMGRRPFVSPASSAPPPGVPMRTPEAIPEAPPPVARPVAPAAQGPTRSRLLDAAYKIMADGNAYESAAGQDAYMSGLSEQGKFDESATERRQRIQDAEYGADRGFYDQSRTQDRNAALSAQTAAETRNFDREKAMGDESFKASQSDLERKKDIELERMRAASAMAVARVKDATSAGGSTALTDEERAALSKAVGDGRVDLKGITKFQAKVVAQSLIDNPNLNGIHLHAVAVLAANPAAQQKAALVSAVPTILANVRDAGKKLNFSDAQFVGNLQAYAKGQFNDPDFVSYMSQRNDAMQTLAQVMSGVGATDMRTKMESEAAPKSMSPKAWDGWYQGQVAAIRPRIEMYEKKGLLDPGTVAALDAVSTPAAPAAYSDPGKEARYQAWLKTHAH